MYNETTKKWHYASVRGVQLFGDEGKQGGLKAELTIEIELRVGDEAIIQKDIEIPQDVLLGRTPAFSKQAKAKSVKILPTPEPPTSEPSTAPKRRRTKEIPDFRISCLWESGRTNYWQ